MDKLPLKIYVSEFEVPGSPVNLYAHKAGLVTEVGKALRAHTIARLFLPDGTCTEAKVLALKCEYGTVTGFFWNKQNKGQEWLGFWNEEKKCFVAYPFAFGPIAPDDLKVFEEEGCYNIYRPEAATEADIIPEAPGSAGPIFLNSDGRPMRFVDDGVLTIWGPVFGGEKFGWFINSVTA
jgi:hypothetical protein